MGLFGPPDVEKLKARGDVPGLIKALGYEKDSGVRDAAAKALGEVGDTRAVEPLIAALNDGDSGVRRRAAGALGNIGDARAFEPLLPALKGKDESVRLVAAEALGHLGDTRAVEPLLEALKGKDKTVRRSAAEALKTIGWQPGMDETGATYWAQLRDWPKCFEIGAAAVPTLVAMLPDERQNAWLISGLGKIGDPRAVEPLIAALEGNTPEASRAAAEALGHLGDVRAVGALILALEGNGHGVGCAAVRALVQIGDPRVVGALIGALKNRDHSVRSAAFDALVLIGDPRAIEPLTAAYLAKNCADGADAAIIKIGNTLGEKGDPRAIGPWVALLGHKDWSVRKTVSGRLVAMYESGTLDQAARLRILKEREVMANPHEDRISHDDCPDDYHEAHTDSNPHTDLGGSVSSSRFDPASTPASRLPHAGIRPGGGRASAGRL